MPRRFGLNMVPEGYPGPEAAKLGAELDQPPLDAITRLGIVDLVRDACRARPEVGGLRVRAERGRTVCRTLQALERALELTAARVVEGQQLEVVVERLRESLLVGLRDEPVQLAPPCTRQRRQRRVLEQTVCERVLAVRKRARLA